MEIDFHKNFYCLKFDVTNKTEIEQSLEKVKKVLAGDRLSALINNAGLAIGGPMSLMADEQFRSQIEVNLFGARNIINVFYHY